MTLQEQVEKHLGNLGCRLVSFAARVEGNMEHGVVLAEKLEDYYRPMEKYITWQTSREGDNFRGMFWGHYDMNKEDAENDYFKRRRQMIGGSP